MPLCFFAFVHLVFLFLTPCHCCSRRTGVSRQATLRPLANNEDVLWARYGQQIVARVISSLKGKRRSFKGYHDQLEADDVMPEEARNHYEEARFGKVAWEGRQDSIAGPNKQARLKAGKRALGLLQTHSTDEDLAAFLHLSEEPAPRHCLSSQSASANACGSQCLPGAASAWSSLGQPVPALPVPGAASANAWGSQRLPAAASACLGQPMPASRQQGAPLQSTAFAIHILAVGEAGKVRVQQLRHTLGQTLNDNTADQDKVGGVIVDFGSTSEHDGDTVDSIIKAQAQAFANGFLKHFRTQPLEHFHRCLCRNTSLNIPCKLQ